MIMSVHAFLAVGHVRASNMFSPSLASVFMEKGFRTLGKHLQQDGDDEYLLLKPLTGVSSNYLRLQEAQEYQHLT